MDEDEDKNPFGNMSKTQIAIYGLMLGLVIMAMRIANNGWDFYFS